MQSANAVPAGGSPERVTLGVPPAALACQHNSVRLCCGIKLQTSVNDWLKSAEASIPVEGYLATHYSAFRHSTAARTIAGCPAEV